MLLHVGIDDTDSEKGMCTTYVGAVTIDRLKKQGIELIDCPKLIRLNPLWKHKTRGNCAISFTTDVSKNQIQKVKKIVLEGVEELAELNVKSTTPGVTFYQGERIPEKLRLFSKKVVQDVVTIEEAEKLADEIGAEIHKFGIGRGIIGALAAIGHPLEDDWTFELIAHRVKENWGTPRRVDEESVREMDEKTYPQTFDNLDPEAGEIHITPHTPCPILYGIRGETPEDVFEAQQIVKAEEPIERTILYKTNQGTDEHLKPAKIREAKPYHSIIIKGKVIKEPETITGGHVIFTIQDETGKADCAAYEPTRQFRDIVKQLEVEDIIKVYGGIKEKPELPLTINLEKLEIIELTSTKKKINPTCKKCGKRMKSAGKNKGYVCKKCKITLPEEAAEIIETPRKIKPGLHEVPTRARRHLAKPLIRVKSAERKY
ncbi:hypothetical protein AKJ48_00415 [candidate division MSBL1 archaeon SCGC-AAA261O19]|uniref:tRNA(Ile2) 2-agmatinylcytidine synthetase TiaS n=1 Tax=candidate division MSBL1 archaeon SCGC-AAA261O19 TaxID=1698277 RepID=A0A133VF90_9EURY|nr:hypothetical protein AKJ48_00415 [candidate division MSBL1 archaeon SCGC-AAA261O19]